MSLLTASLLALAIQSPPSSTLELGEVAEHRFEEAPLDGLGIESLDELRGKPVLIAYWGHTTWADDWVEDVLVWQSEYGEDLAVIFAEMQAASPEVIEATALRKGWLGSRAMWTREYVAFSGTEWPPSFSLLDNDGRLILNGKSGMAGMSFVKRRMEEIEDAIAEQVRRRREGADDLSPEAGAVLGQFAKGRIGKALTEASRLQGEASGAVLEELVRRIARRMGRAEALIAAGRLPEAKAELDGLEGELGPRPELAERLVELAARLESDGLEAEWAAATALSKLEKRIRAKGLKKKDVKALGKLAEKHAGTKSAARAARWVALSEVKGG